MSASQQDLLIEVGTEELPPGALLRLSDAFTTTFCKELTEARLDYGSSRSFATPRRLAILIESLDIAQTDVQNTRLGPAIAAAFDKDGKPTAAARGFAKSCGVDVEQLDRAEKDGVEKLCFTRKEKGSDTASLIPDILIRSLDQLPIPRRMRWGASRDEFVRPIQWLLILFGTDVIPMSLMGIESGDRTKGHRFMHNQPIVLSAPSEYAEKLETEGSVIAEFDDRRTRIRQQVEAEAKSLGAKVMLDEQLLDEVTSLVEYPVALTGEFDSGFLEVPPEALILSMQSHQKYFCLTDANGKLLPKFITISNLKSNNPAKVIEGNERVIRPRLADARFFFEADKKQTLESRLPALKKLKFQDRLGSVFDKSQRVTCLSAWIAEQLDADPTLCDRAAKLAKADLLTQMVNEFADLQGLMGYYYALHDGEDEAVAVALEEQYRPKQAGAALPGSLTGAILAIADKLDTIVGLFGVGQPPTGSKDPFALRRSAIGVLRILVEKELDLNIYQCLQKSFETYDTVTLHENTVQDVFDFMLERFKAWYAEEGVGLPIIQSVLSVKPQRPLDFHRRIQAVSHFVTLDEADALAAANKRVGNLLAKESLADSDLELDEELFEEAEEKALYAELRKAQSRVGPLFDEGDYMSGLQDLAQLKASVDAFFDNVLVMSEDKNVRANRLKLLTSLRELFLRSADISHLHAG